MTTKTNRDNARKQYFAKQQAASKALEEIKEALQNHAMAVPCVDDRPEPNFGHVGDIASAAAKLQEIADQLLQRGEYA